MEHYPCVSRTNPTGYGEQCVSKQVILAKKQKLKMHVLLLVESFVCALESAIAMSTENGLFYGHDLLPTFLMGLSHALFFAAMYVAIWLFIETVVATSKMSGSSSMKKLNIISKFVFTPCLWLSTFSGWACWIAMCMTNENRELHRRLLIAANISVLGMGWSALSGLIYFSYLLNRQIATSMGWMTNSAGGNQGNKDARKLGNVIKNCIRFVTKIFYIAIVMTAAMVGVASVWGITIYQT